MDHVARLIENASGLFEDTQTFPDDVALHRTRTAYVFAGRNLTKSRAPQRAFGRGPGVFEANVARSPDADPYPGWPEMLAAGRPFMVSDTCHNHAVWTDLENYLFRVHHDAIHILTTAPAFSFAGEVVTWFHTALDLDINPRHPSRAGLALFVEIVGQSAHFAKHGAFPVNGDGMQPLCNVSDLRWQALAAQTWNARDAFVNQAWIDSSKLCGVPLERMTADVGKMWQGLVT